MRPAELRSGKGDDPLGLKREHEWDRTNVPLFVRKAVYRYDQRLINLVIREEIRVFRRRKVIKKRLSYDPVFIDRLAKDEGTTFFIAETVAGEFLGMMGVRINPHFYGPQGYILCAYVVPVERKNMTVLKALESKVEDHVKQLGCSLLFCDVKPRGGVRVFKKNGYSHLGMSLVKEV